MRGVSERFGGVLARRGGERERLRGERERLADDGGVRRGDGERRGAGDKDLVGFCAGDPGFWSASFLVAAGGDLNTQNKELNSDTIHQMHSSAARIMKNILVLGHDCDFDIVF